MRLHLRPTSLLARLPRRTVRLRLTVLYGTLFLVSGAGLLAITNVLARSWPWPGLPSIIIPDFRGAPAGLPAQRSATLYHYLQVEGAQVTSQQLNKLLISSAVALGVMALVAVVLGWAIAGRALRPLREMTATARRISEENLNERLAAPGPGDELKDLGDTIDGLLERLESAFAAQRNFVANASHELRTPLTLTRTLLQMVLTDPRPTLATYRTICEEVLTAGEQQEQLIEALLTLARSQRGLDHHEPLDLATITSTALHAHEAGAAVLGLAITTSIRAAPVQGDARLLERLTANLIDNAIRHNVPSGQIDIQVTATDGCSWLKITNTGPLIPADQANDLLEPFHRLSTRRPAGDEGLGLGLSIVAAIAKAHRAALTINPGPQGGLSIVIIFPPHASQSSPANRSDHRATKEDAAGTATKLVLL
jgi:signal transduction histidine kinase